VVGQPWRPPAVARAGPLATSLLRCGGHDRRLLSTVLALGALASPAAVMAQAKEELVVAMTQMPGTWNPIISSMLANDTPVVMAVTFVFSTLVIACNLLADILYGWLDPRISFS